MRFEGNVWKFGDNIDTDTIIPARFLSISEKSELAGKCFADQRPEFAHRVSHGDIIIAGSNFGCGSSREHAPLSIKTAGISVIIARSFARIFYRNAFNIGLPVVECEDGVKLFREGEKVFVDLVGGELSDMRGESRCFIKPVPGFMLDIVQAGGLVNYVKSKVGN